MSEKRKYTSDEFLSMTDPEGRYELVSGELYDIAPSPNTVHQDLSLALGSEIRQYIKQSGGKCRVFTAPYDVKINNDTTVQPDVFVVCDPDKIDDKRCSGVPDWVIEILSPTSVSYDCIIKLEAYLKAEVPEYWIVSPEGQTVIVYRYKGKTDVKGMYRCDFEFYSFDDEIPVGIYKNAERPLTVCINKL